MYHPSNIFIHDTYDSTTEVSNSFGADFLHLALTNHYNGITVANNPIV